MLKQVLLFVSACFAAKAHAQFAPEAGQPGTTAMHKDSSAFIDWANACTVVRGLQNIANPSAGYASAGDSTMATGPAGTGSIVSLGDGGWAICRFSTPVRNGAGYDFAVFENSFTDYFLELAFVEVSTDGINYFRFPATSLRQDTVQADSFDTLAEAEALNNLAGKYRGMYGTPFDLEELSGISGLDVSNINYIKIIDVVGSISNGYSTYDQYGNKVNDPWPTEFPTGGFDLDAVGVINNQLNGISENGQNPFRFYPNPCRNTLFFSGPSLPQRAVVSDMHGRTVLQPGQPVFSLDFSSLDKGIYVVTLYLGDQVYHSRIVKE